MSKTDVLLQADFYKMNHYNMYPKGTSRIYSNLTPRKSRLPGINSVVVFGIQYFILEYIIKQWNDSFFGNEMQRELTSYHSTYNLKKNVISSYKRLMDNTLGKGAVDTEHLEKLWDLGYMPLEIKALPEGILCPIGVPCMTVDATHGFGWLTNFLETILSCTVWQPMTSATIAHQYRKLLNKYAFETTGSTDFVQWQGHDFSMRGMSSLESACTSGGGHLLSFTGTDTVPAISWLEQYYGADVEKELVGTSVPATEHSIMCMGLRSGELETFSRLLDFYPSGILSVVSDTWNLWDVIKQGGLCEQLKEKILLREGKLVIRPDSGDPVDIICGLPTWDDNGRDSIYDTFNDGDIFYNITEKRWIKFSKNSFDSMLREYGEDSSWDHIDEFYETVTGPSKEAAKGVIECLWDIFGGTVTSQGFKVLDSHIGAIYGDSITLERAEQICERLKAKGFASTNIVFGIGSYTYQHNTRDTFGMAMKATYGEVATEVTHEDGHIEWEKEKREIFKDPITDSGEKKSARGLLRVDYDKSGKVVLFQQQTEEQAKGGLLETVFLNGKMIKTQTLSEIRERLAKSL